MGGEHESSDALVTSRAQARGKTRNENNDDNNNNKKSAGPSLEGHRGCGIRVRLSLSLNTY